MDEARSVKSSSKRGLPFCFAFVFSGFILNVYGETICTQQPLSQAFVAADNRTLKYATIWSGSVGSRVTCVSKCHSLPACKSVNYYQLNRVCDLNNATRIDFANNLVADYASVYFDGHGDTPGFSVAAYSDCQSLLEAGYSVSGIYTIFPAGFADGLRVYCDMETDGGGWLVIQRRQDGSVDFYRDWADYRVGFGDLAGEFWLGNDNLRTLSDSSGSWDLRIDLEDWDGNTAWSQYGDFRISGQDYLLSFGSYNATSSAGDSLTYHNLHPFSTKDKDNDNSWEDCAVWKKGAWWYNECSYSNLNGVYLYPPSNLNIKGIIWSSLKGNDYSLKGSSMKIRQSLR
ncbi:ficolin-1-like [Patiria miniata]|uniref:Fibrinogen C-terminal domain-containing protein n=1 Tax=Patiria miniata TaxID=46514 RepID=A0A913ZLY3_PATMI|nr:ficolin-1-like [Patiria miniata]